MEIGWKSKFQNLHSTHSTSTWFSGIVCRSKPKLQQREITRGMSLTHTRQVMEGDSTLDYPKHDCSKSSTVLSPACYCCLVWCGFVSINLYLLYNQKSQVAWECYWTIYAQITSYILGLENICWKYMSSFPCLSLNNNHPNQIAYGCHIMYKYKLKKCYYVFKLLFVIIKKNMELTPSKQFRRQQMAYSNRGWSPLLIKQPITIWVAGNIFLHNMIKHE